MAAKSSAAQNYPDYTGHKSFVARHLTLEMYERLHKKTTPNGVTLDKCIQPSIDYTGDVTGLAAGDPESYEVFSELFDAVINEWHLGFGPDAKHPAPDLDSSKLRGGQLDPKYVKSCRVRAGCNVKGFCLPPSITRAERREVERVLINALSGLTGDLAGKYYPLGKMTKEEETQMIADHFLFQKPTGHLMVNSGAVRDWADARGIWHNLEKTFLIWLNEEDQCRIISMQQGGDVQATFERFGRGLTEDPRFEDIIHALELQKRGTFGDQSSEIVDDVFDISNRARLKKTERQFVQLLIDGVEKLIEMEKRLEEGKSIDDLIPGQKKLYSAARNYPDYTGHGCMVGRHLTIEMYERLYKKTTPHGVTLDKCIQPSIDNSGAIIGLVAGDPESYEVFKELFDAVINEQHLGFGPDAKQPAPDLDASKLIGGQLNPAFVKSCRIRAGRSVKGFCLPPSITRAERREVERVIVNALSGLTGDLAGKYYPLGKMTKEEETQMIADPRFEDIVLGLELQKREAGGEHTDAVGDIYDMSNRDCLKKSEREFVQLLIFGVRKLIDMEKRLAEGKPIDDLIPKKA